MGKSEIGDQTYFKVIAIIEIVDIFIWQMESIGTVYCVWNNVSKTKLNILSYYYHFLSTRA